MIMKYIFLTICILAISSFLTKSRKIDIYISEYDYSFTPQKDGCVDTLLRVIEDGRKLKMTLLDCRGKMYLECFKNNKKSEDGNYSNSLDLLKKYTTRVDGIKGAQTIQVREFYQPLRSGTWCFYDKNGNLIRKQNYKNGIATK